MRQKGFTLLELLLVVGIAAILIVAGITTYNLVTRGNQINEAVRLINTLADQTRRLYSSQSTYGTGGSNIEPALYNAGAVPARYLSATPGTIISPFSTGDRAVWVIGSPTAGEFRIFMAVPPSLVPEISTSFSPVSNSNVVSIDYCGQSPVTTAIDPATVAAACGSGSVAPAAENLRITFH